MRVMSWNGSPLIALLAFACLPAMVWADSNSWFIAFGPLSVTVAPAAADVYRLDVSPEATPGADGAGSSRPEGGTTEMRLRDGWLEVHRADQPDGPALWRGRFSSLASYGRQGVPGTRLEWSAAEGEAIYGLGQRFNGLNQAGQHVEMWIRDAPGQGDGNLASYFCTPVLFSSAGYAIFAAENPEGDFAFNPLGEGLNRYLRAGQTWTVYVAVAPTLKELVQQRARVQGPFRGIPDWAWGPWISRNSYENQGEAEEAIQGMVQRGLPVGAIVQEAWKGPYETGEFNSFSKGGWPDLDRYFSLCRQHAIQTVLWQVPVTPPSQPGMDDLVGKGTFVRKPDGSVSWRREWLDGMANIDFTRPAAVAWWKDQMRDEIRLGVRGFKADDGEDIKPDDVFADGRRGWQMHNEYSALYAKALYELFDEEKVDGILWCRSASLGCERTPALWAGDQFATWAQYRSLLPAGLSAGLSGAPFWGHDVGGYIDNPSPDLYIRWLQFGTFSPLMQYHGIRRREPWEFGPEAEKAYRLLSHLRMNLRPTLRALGQEVVRTGLPLLRPLALEFPDDARFRNEDTQYMLGPDLLVAPVLQEGASGRLIKFPAGTWQHLLLPFAVTGPCELEVPIEWVGAPVFVRQGATLEVELAEDARLGHWSAGAPVRLLRYEADRPRLLNPRFPLSAKVGGGAVTVAFAVADGFAGRLRAYSYPRGEPQRRTPLDIQWTPERGVIELTYPGEREAEFTVVLHDEQQPVFVGTVRWRAAAGGHERSS